MMFKRTYWDYNALNDAAKCLERATKAAWHATNGSASRSFPCADTAAAVAAEIKAAQALIKKAQPEK